MLTLLIPCLALSCFSWSGSSDQSGEPFGDTTVQVGQVDEAWLALVKRNEQLSFTQRAGMDAARELSAGGLNERRKALVLLTLGASKRADSEPFLLDASRGESNLLRRAAMLALGEAGLVDLKLLSEWMESPDANIREAALLAGLLSAEPHADVVAQRIAEDELHAMYEAARRIYGFYHHPEVSEQSDAARWYLEQRYEAAKQFGLIGGDSWSEIVMKRVVSDDAFLDAIVLPASAKMFANGVNDHLLHALLDGQGRARVTAAVTGMPRAVNKLFERELWQPQTADEWDALFDAIWENRLEGRVRSILVSALDTREQRFRAAASVARLADKEVSGVIRPSVLITEDTTYQERIWAIEFLVGAGGDDVIDDIYPYLEDSNRAVRAKARVALLRLGNAGADTNITELFTIAGESDRDAVLLELCMQTHSNEVWKLLHELLALEVLGLEQRIRVGANLILTSRSGPQETFSDDVRSLPLWGELGALTVKALGQRGLKEDLEFIVEHFPSEDDEIVNLAIAQVLVERGMPEALPLLQSAIWRGPWDRSILACGLLVETFGFRALTDELERPPAAATSKDLRRVGFALGEFGGLERAEAFARQLRTGTGDPILQGALLGALSARTH